MFTVRYWRPCRRWCTDLKRLIHCTLWNHLVLRDVENLSARTLNQHRSLPAVRSIPLHPPHTAAPERLYVAPAKDRLLTGSKLNRFLANRKRADRPPRLSNSELNARRTGNEAHS
jgi:hypothetical protein